MSDEQQPDPRPGAYYVSATDGKRSAMLLGPFDKHQMALDMVELVRAVAERTDPRAAFYAFGTARMPDDDSVPLRYGSMNEMFGLPAR